MRYLEGSWRKAGCPALLLTPDFCELVKSLTETQHVSYMTPGKHLYSCTSLGEIPPRPQILLPLEKISGYATDGNRLPQTSTISIDRRKPNPFIGHKFV